MTNKPRRGQFDPAPGTPPTPTHLSYPLDFFTTDYPPHDRDRRATIDGMDGDESLTNGERATSAANIAPAIIDAEWDYEFSDLIGDLLHLAHSKGFDPVSVARSALDNFHAEAAPLDAIA